MTNDDMALVKEFAASQSEPAFAQLVQRYVGLVHTAAVRQVGDEGLAEEVTQAVFLILARKAPSLGSDTILPAWLYRTARFVAMDALRTQRRRQAREQEAFMRSTLMEENSESIWTQLAPLLDEAMAQLSEGDRAALVLRYFENKSTEEIASTLHLEKPTVQKRVERALEKLRMRLSRRGVKFSATVIATALMAHSVKAAPIALSQLTTSVAVTNGAAAAGSTLSLVKGAFAIMAWTKTKTAIVATAIIMIAGGTTTGIIYRHEIAHQLVLEGGRIAINRKLAAPIDLNDYYERNSAFDPPVHYYPWRHVPRGFQVFHHVPLDIDGIMYLYGETYAKQYHQVFPESITGIELNRRFETLYVYHTTFSRENAGTPVYSIVFNYGADLSATNELCFGDQLLDWTPNVKKLDLEPKDPHSKVAWIGGSFAPDKNQPIRFILTGVKNPYPQLEVTSIDLYSSHSKASGVIFAMTTGKATLMR